MGGIVKNWNRLDEPVHLALDQIGMIVVQTAGTVHRFKSCVHFDRNLQMCTLILILPEKATFVPD